MFKVLSIYTVVGLIAALCEFLSFQFLFKFKQNYLFASRYSYLFSALISFMGNLKYGFKVDISLNLFLTTFPIVLIINSFLIYLLSKYYKINKVLPFYANIVNIFATSLCNLVLYTIIKFTF